MNKLIKVKIGFSIILIIMFILMINTYSSEEVKDLGQTSFFNPTPSATISGHDIMAISLWMVLITNILVWVSILIDLKLPNNGAKQ